MFLDLNVPTENDNTVPLTARAGIVDMLIRRECISERAREGFGDKIADQIQHAREITHTKLGDRRRHRASEGKKEREREEREREREERERERARQRETER
jgi:hypothetical protein